MVRWIKALQGCFFSLSLDECEILQFYASLNRFETFVCQRKNPFNLGEGILQWLHWWLYSLFKFLHYIYPSFILSAYAKQERQSVAGCHESPCLLEPLKFQPLLCRGVPLFEASFSCQCFVQNGEWAFGMAQWWERVHLGSNDRLECTSAASRFWNNLWTDWRCIQDKSDFWWHLRGKKS